MATYGSIRYSGITDAGISGGANDYNDVNALPQNPSLGDLAFITTTNALYVYNGSAWFNIAIANQAPTAITGNQASYALATDGTPTIVTLVSTDPEGFPLTWSATASGDTQVAALTQADNVFTITPSTSDTDAGTLSVTFSVTDGSNTETSISSFTLSFNKRTTIPLDGTLSSTVENLTLTLIENDGSFQGTAPNQSYRINSRSTAANRLRWQFDGTPINNFEHVMIRFEYYWYSGDNFATTFHSNRTAWRTNRGVSGGQSGSHLGVGSPTASTTWPTPSNTWLPVVIYHNRINHSGYLQINGTKVIECPAGGGNASTVATYSSSEELCFAQFFNSAASDNGIDMAIAAIDIVAWNGTEENPPQYNARFTV